MARNVIREIRNQVRAESRLREKGRFINVPYANLELLIERGVGSNANEVCKNLIGVVDEIDINNDNAEPPYSDFHRVRIVGARVEHHPSSMYPYYVHVDAEEINGQK